MIERSKRASTGEARAASEQEDRRVAPRTDVGGLWCDRGQIIDLSVRGMRLISPQRWSEGQILNVSISDEQDAATLVARCVWCRQEGLYNHAIGLAFDSVSDERSAAIRSMAQRHAAGNSEKQ